MLSLLFWQLVDYSYGGAELFTFPCQVATHLFHTSLLHRSIHREHSEVRSQLPGCLLPAFPTPCRLPKGWCLPACSLFLTSFKTLGEILKKISSGADPMPGTADLCVKDYILDSHIRWPQQSGLFQGVSAGLSPAPLSGPIRPSRDVCCFPLISGAAK